MLYIIYNIYLYIYNIFICINPFVYCSSCTQRTRKFACNPEINMNSGSVSPHVTDYGSSSNITESVMTVSRVKVIMIRGFHIPLEKKKSTFFFLYCLNAQYILISLPYSNL